MIGKEALRGRRVLVVEDEYFIAEDIVEKLGVHGALVVGPVSTVQAALALLSTEALDGAVLDLNLGGEMAYPVADALNARAVPFVFATGYDQASIPAQYAHIAHCQKPVDAPEIARGLFGLPTVG